MGEKDSVPAIRFAGFTDDWERRKLEDFLDVSGEKNFGGAFTRNDVLSVSGELGIVNQIEFQGRSFAGASVLNYGIVGTGDVVYTKSPLKTNPYGIIKTNKGKPGIVSTLYAVYHTRADVFPDFIQCYFEQDARVNNYLYPLVNKGAKNDMKVSAENALKGIVTFPKYNEQMTVARFLSTLDHLITLHQRKYLQLCNIKKSMLERMFPREGATVPEIRFARFTGAWEWRKLGNIANKTYGGGTPKTSAEEFWQGEIPWFQSSDLVEHEVQSAVYKKGITELGLQKSAAQLIPENSIAIVTRVGVGKLVLMPVSYATSQDFLSLSDLNIDAQYGCYAIYRMLQREKNSTQGTSIKGITKDELLSKNIPVPIDEEQKKIGAFFSNLDHLITLHQRELECLQNIKKACLEKMFV